MPFVCGPHMLKFYLVLVRMCLATVWNRQNMLHICEIKEPSVIQFLFCRPKLPSINGKCCAPDHLTPH